MSSQPLLNNPSAPQARSIYFRVAAAYGATAVILGAFGAHGLKKRIADPARLANWGTAAQYQVRLPRPLPPDILYGLRLGLAYSAAVPESHTLGTDAA
jgi:hypothetical protein